MHRFINNIDYEKKEATMLLYGDFGYEIDGNKIANDMKYLESEGIQKVTQRINSGGGSILNGLSAVASNLFTPMTVHTINDGVAASMAGIILMTGDEISSTDYGLLMIHDPKMGFDTIEKTKDEKTKRALISFRDQLSKIIQNRCGKTKEEVDDLMNKETWYNANEAKEHGFIDNIISYDKKPKINNEMSIDEMISAITNFNISEISNPYPNFHAARVRDPKDFSSIVVLQTLPNGIMIYGGTLKSEPKGLSKPQAYRFPKDKFTASEAKQWLKDHNIKYILFEKASENNFTNHKTKKMEKLINHFNLAPDATIEEILAKVQEIEAKKEELSSEKDDLTAKLAEKETANTDLTAKVEVLESEKATLTNSKTEIENQFKEANDKLEVIRKKEITAYVENCIKDGKLKEEEKSSLIETAINDFDKFKKIVDSMKVPHANILNQLGGAEKDPRADWKHSDWQKQDPKGLAEMKVNNPEKEKELYEKEYKSKK